jgi:hypothetical protein
MSSEPPGFVPDDLSAPFFAYGLFMPGEIAFFQIADHVKSVSKAHIGGLVRARDGVPVLDIGAPRSEARGWRLTFTEDGAAHAYAAISAMEPRSQYRWELRDNMNVLAGVSPEKGADPEFRDDRWSGWDDPAFIEAPRTVERLIATAEDTWEGFFQVQAACLLLWSSVERYVSLRYGLGRNDKVRQRVLKLVDEEPFRKAVAETSVGNPPLRRVYRSDDPRQSASFVATDPRKSIDYLYQVRSNATHRGKNPRPDSALLRVSTGELLRIFRATHTGARLVAEQQRARWSSDGAVASRSRLP